MNRYFHSNGKLLLTAEYVVLDGATALAIPTKYGQSLEIESTDEKGIHWKSLDDKGAIWFEETFDLNDFEPTNAENTYSKTLTNILLEARKLNLDFPSEGGMRVQTKLEFPRNWGLGTSSTLINNIAQWANVDAFTLLNKSFGGSGYDIAAAQNEFPILYQLKDGNPNYKQANISWNFKNSLFFVYLNEKQDSKEGIARYRNLKVTTETIQRISEISHKLLECTTLSEFENLMNYHEEIISETIKLPTIKDNLFSDYPNAIKSLGAWGGDFVLVTGSASGMEYFRDKGFNAIIPFEKMVL